MVTGLPCSPPILEKLPHFYMSAIYIGVAAMLVPVCLPCDPVGGVIRTANCRSQLGLAWVWKCDQVLRQGQEIFRTKLTICTQGR